MSSEIKYQHQGLASGRWFDLSFAEQMGNIGSEVTRTFKWFLKKDKRLNQSFERTLELFDLTLSDKRWLKRNKEICRGREYFCYLIFTENIPDLPKEIRSFEKYFNDFAFIVRKSR